MSLLAGFLLTLAAGACPPPAHATFDVLVLHGPIALRSDYKLAEISGMAATQAAPLAHEPVGFYRADMQPSVQVDLADPDVQGCHSSVYVMVKLALTNRQIQIAKDLADKQCTMDAARTHYREHAAADDAVVSEFAKALKVALPRMLLPPDGGMWSAKQPRQEITRTLAETVERSLVGLDSARDDARNRVDTPDEIAKLEAPCGNGPVER